MVTSLKIKENLRDLRIYIDPPIYENVSFSLGDFELYISGDDYAEGDEPFVLIASFEGLLEELYNANQDSTRRITGQAPSTTKIELLLAAMDDYLGDLGYDWNYPSEVLF